MRASDHLPERWNAAEHFIGRHVREGRGERAAIVTDDGVWSYGRLDEAVRGFAGALRAADVHRGERVALLLHDGPLFAAAFWGTLAAGAVAVPLNTRLEPAKLAAILADCEPRVVVHDPALAVPAGADGASAWSGAEAERRARAAAPAGYERTHRDAFAFLLYSSGTTGEPKGVVHLMHDPWVCARAFGAHVLETRADDRAFSVAKLFFAYGLGNAQVHPFDAGAAAVLHPGRPTPEAVFDQVRRHRPTLFFAVPTAYAQMLAAQDGGAQADFSSVRRCVSAGEALPPALFERWRARTGLEILDGIGSTEACHTFISARAGDCRPGSCGRPVPGYDARVVDETGQDAARGEIGDLLIRGDSTMALYWNKHEATKRALAGGDWLRTGDKVLVDDDGFFFHAGRGDDMLKVAGMWVSPVEVEAVLAAHPAVLECAVVGRADDNGLIVPHAVVALRPDADAAGLAAALVAFARERLAHHKCPRAISFVQELPRTATGKLQRFLLRSR